VPWKLVSGVCPAFPAAWSFSWRIASLTGGSSHRPFPIYYNSLWPIGLSDRAYWPRPLAFQTHSASGGFDLAVPV